MKRINIAIIPNKNLNSITQSMGLNKDLLPRSSDFHSIDYHNLIIKNNLKEDMFDIIVDYKIAEDTSKNICTVSYEIKRNFPDTLFLASFNEANARHKGRDADLEKVYIDNLLDNDIGFMKGIVVTPSIDHIFIFSILRDMVSAPEMYKKVRKVIRSQADFLFYKPDYTDMGYRKDKD